MYDPSAHEGVAVGQMNCVFSAFSGLPPRSIPRMRSRPPTARSVRRSRPHSFPMPLRLCRATAGGTSAWPNPGFRFRGRPSFVMRMDDPAQHEHGVLETRHDVGKNVIEGALQQQPANRLKQLARRRSKKRDPGLMNVLSLEGAIPAPGGPNNLHRRRDDLHEQLDMGGKGLFAQRTLSHEHRVNRQAGFLLNPQNLLCRSIFKRPAKDYNDIHVA